MAPRLWRGAAALVSAAGSIAARGQTTLYVDDDAPPGGNGASWATAYRDLNEALARAATLPPPISVRIGAGLYLPPNAPPQSSSFVLAIGVDLFGGYRGLT